MPQPAYAPIVRATLRAVREAKYQVLKADLTHPTYDVLSDVYMGLMQCLEEPDALPDVVDRLRLSVDGLPNNLNAAEARNAIYEASELARIALLCTA